ncbi:MAG: hypothetical protein D3923_11310, partial [Candidatus Electrothrix sp. AR3]|nr:hypothetical protein [Candidatus Electrothrix sp. AR3]
KLNEQEGEEAISAEPLFSQDAIENREYVQARDDLRQEVTTLDTIADGREAFAANDQADGFVDSFSHSGLQSMEGNGLMHARLNESPWSDDYWAIYLGVLGKRYADPHFPGSSDWNANYNYTQNNPAAAILANGNTDAVNRLSPSEKYDILVGDSRYSLTKKMWEEGKGYYLSRGSVETWMGICHGWAPAAYMLPRPTGSATVLAVDGRTYITFYPSDIKALASLLWAKAAPQMQFIGGRCNDLNPPKDSTGRILSKQCFDTNPGSWHLAVVNQIGASQRSMVMDATYDYQVWNQPVVGYNYSYFNPATRSYASSLAGATVARADFQHDKFAQYRSPETDSIAGISMEVSYTVETAPTHNSTDGSHRDMIKKVNYMYDLELNFTGKIIGGEWYQNAHPDFLWTPARGKRALTPWEARSPLAGIWQSNQPIPEQWQQIATITSEYSKTPLAIIVEQLIAFSNR